MKELNDAIREQGVCIGDSIVKVDMFLNHRIDTALLQKMGEAFYEAFHKQHVDLILTVEASGIALAVAAANAFGHLPVVFAKKGSPANLDDSVYHSKVYSFTHRMENTIRVAKSYLPKGTRVLIIDDFLANGEAAMGLVDIANQAGAEVAGIGICIEKGFQSGGATLRSAGYKVVALATVTGVHEGKPVLLGE